MLYSPKTLAEEWEKHRKLELKGIEAVLKKHRHTIKTSELFQITPAIGDAQLTAADKLLRSLVEDYKKVR